MNWRAKSTCSASAAFLSSSSWRFRSTSSALRLDSISARLQNWNNTKIIIPMLYATAVNDILLSILLFLTYNTFLFLFDFAFNLNRFLYLS